MQVLKGGWPALALRHDVIAAEVNVSVAGDAAVAVALHDPLPQLPRYLVFLIGGLARCAGIVRPAIASGHHTLAQFVQNKTAFAIGPMPIPAKVIPDLIKGGIEPSDGGAFASDVLLTTHAACCNSPVRE